jgi:hypothetical protein
MFSFNDWSILLLIDSITLCSTLCSASSSRAWSCRSSRRFDLCVDRRALQPRRSVGVHRAASMRMLSSALAHAHRCACARAEESMRRGCVRASSVRPDRQTQRAHRDDRSSSHRAAPPVCLPPCVPTVLLSSSIRPHTSTHDVVPRTRQSGMRPPRTPVRAWRHAHHTRAGGERRRRAPRRFVLTSHMRGRFVCPCVSPGLRAPQPHR